MHDSNNPSNKFMPMIYWLEGVDAKAMMSFRMEYGSEPFYGVDIIERISHKTEMEYFAAAVPRYQNFNRYPLDYQVAALMLFRINFTSYLE